MKRLALIAAAVASLSGFAESARADDLVAAVLPSSRSTVVNVPTTVFASIINTSGHVANGCAIATSTPGVTLSYQPTNSNNNEPSGPANTPVTIATSGSQSFILSITSSVVLTAFDLPLTFTCTNTAPAAIVSGLDTLLLNVSSTPTADIVALVATVTNDGILTFASEEDARAFAVASINLGPDATITVTPDLGDFSTLPVTLTICETNTAGACMATPTPSVTLDDPHGATPTFAIFAQVTGPVPFAPGSIRISVLFTDASGTLRGRTSVALKTPENHHQGTTPGGIYIGMWNVTSTPSTPQPVAAMVSEDGEFHLLPGILATDRSNATPILRETLSLSTFDNLSLTASGNSYAAGVGETPVTGDVVGTGIFSPHQALVINTQSGTETGVFHLNYVRRFYERQTPLANTAGTWNLRDEGLHLAGTVTIAHDGTFTGMTSGGCGLSGSLSIIDKRYDVLRVSLTLAACGTAASQDFTGLTSFQHSVPRQELQDDPSKQMAVGNDQEEHDEDADDDNDADREMVTELSNSTDSLSYFVTAK